MALLALSDFVLVMNIFGPFFAVFLYLNAILIIVTIIFLKPRQVTSIYLWIASFLLLPMVFIVFYIYFGRDYHHQKVFRTKSTRDFTVLNRLATNDHMLRKTHFAFFSSGKCFRMNLVSLPSPEIFSWVLDLMIPPFFSSSCTSIDRLSLKHAR